MAEVKRVQVRTYESKVKGSNNLPLVRATAVVYGTQRTVSVNTTPGVDRIDNHRKALQAFCIRHLMDLSTDGVPEYAGTGIVGDNVCDYWNVNLKP